MSARPTRGLRLAAVLGGLAVSLAAAPAARAARHSTPRTLAVTAKDYSFDAPARVPAGATTIHLVNHGAEAHHIWVIQLAPGKTLAQYLDAARTGAPPRWATNIGGPNAVAPGGESSATVVLTPGRYALLCFVPSADGVPHLMKGMARELTVTGPDPHDALPPADLSLRLADYAFAFSRPLTAGHHVVRVTNASKQPHEVTLWRLPPGVTPRQIAAWAEHPSGRPPALPLGGVTGIDPGRAADWPVDVQPGDYALLCFVPDANDAKPHTAHGMLEKITVR
jgi:uncharacterized cupredoxin-like copper-binding protein